MRKSGDYAEVHIIYSKTLLEPFCQYITTSSIAIVTTYPMSYRVISDTNRISVQTVDSEHKPETQPASSSNQGTIVSCSVCSAEIGIQHSETASVTLYKWQITLAFSSDNARTQPDLANCVASMLISTLSRSGCSKSIILPVGSSNSTLSDSLLNIWLFNGNISFTSTARLETETVPAVKILYRFVSKEEAERMSESMTSDVQDITLPASAVDSLKRLLGESSEWLPKDDRKFKEWAVGLLVKWKGLG